jgi:hypothetical protein
MQKRSETFGVTLSNIPHINLRNEFARYYNALKEDEFIAQFEGTIKPIKTPYMIWFGMPDDLITFILQRAILGVESYLSGAVYIELLGRGFLKINLHLLRNPFGLGGKGTVENFYHRLPSLIDKTYSLKLYNNELFQKTVIFYKEVRNPIFHGNNLSNRDIKGLRRLFDYLFEIYAWIDNWHDFSKIFENGE